MKTGIELITEERDEQIKKHGRTLKHDSQHEGGELAEAAAICASNHRLYWKQDFADSVVFTVLDFPKWQLPVKYNGNILIDNFESNKGDRIHQLKVAGALMAAEIDRLQKSE